MGLLREEEILEWDEYKNVTNDFKILALKQFINLFNLYRSNKGTPFKWGYEIEYTIIKKEKSDYKINIIADTLINKSPNSHPEYGNWMIEKIPNISVFELNSKRMKKDKVKKTKSKHSDSKIETSLLANGLLGVLSTFLSIYISIKSLIMHPELLIKKEPIKNKKYQYDVSIKFLSR